MVQRTAVNWLGIVFRGVRFGLKRATLHGRPFLVVETAICAAHKLSLGLVLLRPQVSEAVGALSIERGFVVLAHAVPYDTLTDTGLLAVLHCLADMVEGHRRHLRPVDHGVFAHFAS